MQCSTGGYRLFTSICGAVQAALYHVQIDYKRAALFTPLEHSSNLDTDQRYHSLDVVGEDVRRDLCFHVPQRSGLEVGRAHPRLDGAKRVVDRA